MDPTQVFPPEMTEYIFSFLPKEVLWNCLGVSKKWRTLANSNNLWKRHCRQLGLHVFQDVDHDTPLCHGASTYYHCYLLPFKNWKFGKFKSYNIEKENRDFIECWDGRIGAVYYHNIDKLCIYEIELDSIETVEFSCFDCFPLEKHTISLALNEDYIAISKFNLVIVYKKINNYYYKYKLINFTEEKEVKISNYVGSMDNKVCVDDILQVKIISGHILWMCKNDWHQIFVINLMSDYIKILPKRMFRYYSPSNYVVSFEDDIIVYDLNGNQILAFNAKPCQPCICCNGDILVVGNKETQKIETWDLKSKEKLLSKYAPYQTDAILHPHKDILILNEKTREINRYSCINPRTGEIIWKFSENPEKRSRVLRIVSEYILIIYTQMDRLMFNLRKLTDGSVVDKGLIPQDGKRLIPENITTVLWVYTEYNKIKVRSYMNQ